MVFPFFFFFFRISYFFPVVLFNSKVVNHDTGISWKLYLVQRLKGKRRLMEAERGTGSCIGGGGITNIFKLWWLEGGQQRLFIYTCHARVEVVRWRWHVKEIKMLGSINLGINIIFFAACFSWYLCTFRYCTQTRQALNKTSNKTKASRLLFYVFIFLFVCSYICK